MFRNALKIGVKIRSVRIPGVASRSQRREFALMTGLGLSPAAALRSATTVAASLLGVDDRGALRRRQIGRHRRRSGQSSRCIQGDGEVSFVMKG